MRPHSSLPSNSRIPETAETTSGELDQIAVAAEKILGFLFSRLNALGVCGG